MTHAPIFIVGANRSGTTLLRLILNAHSRIGIPEELVYFNGKIGGIPIERWRNPELSPDEYETFLTGFLQKNCQSLDELNTSQLKRDILRGGTFNFRKPYRSVLETWARHHGKERWGEKTPGNLFFLDVILEMFPKAKFIYLTRDPRAGVYSMNNADFLANDTTINALNRRHYANDGVPLLEHAIPSDQRILLRYEDLVQQPEEIIRDVCTFLDEKYETSMLYFHQDAEQYMKERASGKFNQAATRPIDASKVDAWEGQLSSEDIAVIEFLCQKEMKTFGYVPKDYSMSLSRRLKMFCKWFYYQTRRWRNPNAPQFILKERVFARSRNRARDWLPFFTSNTSGKEVL